MILFPFFLFVSYIIVHHFYQGISYVSLTALVFSQFYLILLVILEYGTYLFLVILKKWWLKNAGKMVIKYFWFFYFLIGAFLHCLYCLKENNQLVWYLTGLS